ncbi:MULTISPECIES: YciI family protein [Rhodococcus]|uniref:YciI family protein n=1 Tax=Rhodococcus oxybenzonivorans TaxID=1990687 RepID=A0AAE5A6U7_9NOCA|nr:MULTISPECIES: YciI family protein [Rhodococcus]MDV7245820.1 YciI family protein [Rhodococcus oxybenzonivorans]MDV7264864.1 YciI family protein [Rhodococcus oxybenzonivorans]MDV7277376.1 YciI family protein [Rhodococcus oxybenzonivorans]MDV7336946.1 YciI family protein [Rhodococcus oxybenzonivorans]MDV7347088.1 YciI family protein [Rhodococcus oxybenzonivorans]
MSLFVVEYTYNPETSSRRDDHRGDHRGWIAEMIRRKVVRSTGPLADGTGAFIIADGPDEETVTRLFQQDPFVQAKLVENLRVSEWHPVMGEFSE